MTDEHAPSSGGANARNISAQEIQREMATLRYASLQVVSCHSLTKSSQFPCLTGCPLSTGHYAEDLLRLVDPELCRSIRTFRRLRASSHMQYVDAMPRERQVFDVVPISQTSPPKSSSGPYTHQHQHYHLHDEAPQTSRTARSPTSPVSPSKFGQAYRPYGECCLYLIRPFGPYIPSNRSCRIA